MKTSLLSVLVLILLAAPCAQAQDAGFKGEFLRQFNSDANKLISLAEAMPAESYDWRPMEGVATVADSYMHIAGSNYYYPQSSLGVPAPDGIDMSTFGSIESKEMVVDHLRRSLDHVRMVVENMSAADVDAETTLYGNPSTKRAVLLQLITHMNEHLGQQIAYARSNKVVPPWSQ